MRDIITTSKHASPRKTALCCVSFTCQRTCFRTNRAYPIGKQCCDLQGRCNSNAPLEAEGPQTTRCNNKRPAHQAKSAQTSRQLTLFSPILTFRTVQKMSAGHHLARLCQRPLQRQIMQLRASRDSRSPPPPASRMEAGTPRCGPYRTHQR